MTKSWPRWRTDDLPGLALYVLPTEASRLGRFPGKSNRPAIERLREIYQAVSEADIRYEQEPVGSEPGRQKIRTPFEVLGDDLTGTCLDICVVASGLCLNAGLHPLILVTADHALLGVWVGDNDDDGSTNWDGEPAARYPVAVSTRTVSDLAPLTIRSSLGSLGEIVVVDMALATNDYRADMPRSFEDATRLTKNEIERLDTAEVCDVGVAWRQDDQLNPGVAWDLNDPNDDVFPDKLVLDAAESLSPTQAVRAQYQAIPFQRSDVFRLLLDRCRAASPGLHSVVVHGDGGSGKTRLAIELALQLREESWVADMIHTPGRVNMERLRAIGAPLFVAVDYADSYSTSELVELIEKLNTNRNHPAFMMLLARTDGAWWAEAQGALERHGTQLHAASLSPLPPVAVNPRQLWKAAATRFGADPNNQPKASPVAKWTTLDLILLAWLGARRSREDGELPATRDQLYDEVVDHEHRYWEEAVGGKSQDFRTWAAHLSLCSPRGRSIALKLHPRLDAKSLDAFAQIWGHGWRHSGRVPDGLALKPDAIGDYLVRTYFSTNLAELVTLFKLVKEGDQEPGDEGARPGLATLLWNLRRAETDTASLDAAATVQILLTELLTKGVLSWSDVLEIAVMGSTATARSLAETLSLARSSPQDNRDLIVGLSQNLPIGHNILSELALEASLLRANLGSDSAADMAEQLNNLGIRLSEAGQLPPFDALVSGHVEGLGVVEQAWLWGLIGVRRPDETAAALRTALELISPIAEHQSVGSARRAIRQLADVAEEIPPDAPAWVTRALDSEGSDFREIQVWLQAATTDDRATWLERNVGLLGDKGFTATLDATMLLWPEATPLASLKGAIEATVATGAQDVVNSARAQANAEQLVARWIATTSWSETWSMLDTEPALRSKVVAELLRGAAARDSEVAIVHLQILGLTSSESPHAPAEVLEWLTDESVAFETALDAALHGDFDFVQELALLNQRLLRQEPHGPLLYVLLVGHLGALAPDKLNALEEGIVAHYQSAGDLAQEVALIHLRQVATLETTSPALIDVVTRLIHSLGD